ncbi:MAG: helix-turn-helix transcriptional regulator [Clostridia bacterium]|nr:helix-turn-helix transcriptional regulator [Clostridia bacterium]
MKMSEKIFHCRQRAGLSQEALAERLGVSRQAVSRWECGETTPEPAKILSIARTFGVTADWLLDDELGVVEPQELDAEPEAETPPPPPGEPARTVLIPPPKKRGDLAVGIILLCIGLGCLLFFGAVYLFVTRFTGIRVFNILVFPVALICFGGGIGMVVFGCIYAVRGIRRKNSNKY